MVERITLLVLAVSSVLVCVELAILVPVILTQQRADQNAQNALLQTLTTNFGARVNQTVRAFVYRVARTANSAPDSGFWSEEKMAQNAAVSEDPAVGVEVVYLWVPIVPKSELSSYENFYGFPITHFDPILRKIVPYSENTTNQFFAPYTVFVPPQPNLQVAEGFDIFSVPSLAAQLKNMSRYILAPISLLNRQPNNNAIQAMALAANNRGWAVGNIGTYSVLQFSLAVPASQVTTVAYTASNTSSPIGSTLLYVDPSPDLVNATSLDRFLALPISSQFFMTQFEVLNITFIIGVMYSGDLKGQYGQQTWLILAVVLAPVCFLLDCVVCALLLLWDRRGRQLKAEEGKREYAQVMLGYVNHEIRNPLQTILGVADLHLNDDDDDYYDPNNSNNGGDTIVELRQDELRSIVQAAEAIEHIARDVLDVRRAEEGKIMLTIAEINVASLCVSLENCIRHFLIEKPSITFSSRIDPDLRTISTDRYRLEQILLNFLSNAFKNTNSGTITLDFSFIFTPEQQEHKVRISVQDTGKGISDAMQRRLFRQFSQNSAGDSTELGGFGLGLFLSKMLADILGAQIGFTSHFGIGSTFWIDLPIGNFEKTLSRQFDDNVLHFSKEQGRGIGKGGERK